ncbi:MAG: hypothetical protein R6X32_09355 [Chloroflexota bacterium]
MTILVTASLALEPEEIVLQSYSLPLAAFQADNPAWQPEQLQTIRFYFDGAAVGAIYTPSLSASRTRKVLLALALLLLVIGGMVNQQRSL